MSTLNTPKAALRNDWQLEEVTALFDLPLNELIFRAQGALRGYFDPAQIQLSTLLNIKTGACPEDCAYCPQSVRYDTGLPVEPIMQVQEVITAAQEAKAQGATRFCMGAAWRSPKRKDFEIVLDMVKAVKGLGMETCVTLGMLTEPQVQQLKAAGLDYYNHNLDSSEAFYSQIISTRTYQDRLDTLAHVREAQIKVCCGGIIGMGENLQDRAQLLLTLANLPAHPDSVPINQLIKIEFAPANKHKACNSSLISVLPADKRTYEAGIKIRATAMQRTMSNVSKS